MRIAVASLRSVAPYSQSRYHDTPKINDKEAPDDYEMRTWRERLSYTDDGHVFIPPMAFKKSLAMAASFLGMKIRGRDRATYTKHFKAGILVTDGLILPEKKDNVPGEVFFVPSNGRIGGGTRVKRKFPVIREWAGDVTYYVLDDTITPDVFEAHLKEAGNFIGIGRFRPENGGFYGRYAVDQVNWSEQQMAMAA
ncbi:hypothetical protein EN788_22280 [Mesorhizobium sp. M2D.F.Ca.ET.145.01.1.1]|uniref:hypothetical protein n=1 Tax=unclassified Mesorhizobium TaxID=325217 RepID=UPI000FCABC11|nr:MULTISPECIES: hypothetical protein [unclassified Mesorhizobium]TGU44646.1 hypothetical protein EN789_21830 [bacterium M00.F.Ca.ET.146.01.1.1]TGU58474.1 hypothetical protein EN791_021830 [Mesorhizobium sp. M2D.F.Ca.ET.148.01.1.1]TGU64406.1 hypothetical protein EN790_21825 [Mesorhizobium sp. M2D.F.Ca.ET.147.01.1.1]TGW09982.1 hypothetical protein EN788_22280 [Mesorhizobium sp. M2D.F.Ca.ET.145.01.1.1]